MENESVVARCQGWVGETGMTVAEGVLSGIGTILYFDCGGGYTNLHIGLNSTELQTHTNDCI